MLSVFYIHGLVLERLRYEAHVRSVDRLRTIECAKCALRGCRHGPRASLRDDGRDADAVGGINIGLLHTADDYISLRTVRPVHRLDRDLFHPCHISRIFLRPQPGGAARHSFRALWSVEPARSCSCTRLPRLILEKVCIHGRTRYLAGDNGGRCR